MKRIGWLDFAKGLSIFIVVVGHALRGIYTHKLYMYSDKYLIIIADILFLGAMPVFFALSGYLFKKIDSWKEYAKFIKKKAINLLIPYVIFSIIYVVFQHIGEARDLQTWDKLLNIWYQPISYLWFLYALFLIFAVVGIFSVWHVSVKMQAIIYLVFCIITQLVKIPGWLNFPLTWMFFFYIGVLCKNYKLSIIRKKIAIASLLLSIVILLLDFRFIGINADYNFPHLWNFIPKVLITFLAVMFYANFPNNSTFFRYFEKYGKNSLIIYLVHVPVISAVRTVILHIYLPNIFLMIIVLVATGWYISIFVVFLNKKVKIINMIFSPYTYI